MPHRPRSVIEAELKAAQTLAAAAEAQLARTNRIIEKLKDELANLPSEGIDEALWYARRDPRQIGMFEK